uniref:NADH dehydrogenase [ubiquinone] iron-sulfur protein 4, mitochondrial n=2 Tax=Hemiselmis andersenii TaxID=464988 RepID=A0A6U2HYP7_HEMAN
MLAGRALRFLALTSCCLQISVCFSPITPPLSSILSRPPREGGATGGLLHRIGGARACPLRMSAKGGGVGKKMYTFEEARKYARSFGWASQEEFQEYGCAGAYSLPKNPESLYPEEWQGWDDFLGTPRPFGEAKDAARTLGFKSEKEWAEMVEKVEGGEEWFDARIPLWPNKALAYREEWKSWEDWLGC